MAWINALFSAGLGLGATTQPVAAPPPPDPVVHGVVYFATRSVERLPSIGVDPIAHLAPRIPQDVFVVVEGRADTAGDDDSNLALSLRRARSVARELVERGVEPERITLRACGERDLRRATPDDTPEPLNRSAFFDWRSTPWPVSQLCEQVSYAQSTD